MLKAYYYLLMDGSIRGTLLNFQTGYNIPREIMNYLVRRSSIFDNELKKDEISLESTTQKNQNEILIEIEEKMTKMDLNYKRDISRLGRRIDVLSPFLCGVAGCMHRKKVSLMENIDDNSYATEDELEKANNVEQKDNN